jgi:hypothetical protein
LERNAGTAESGQARSPSRKHFGPHFLDPVQDHVETCESQRWTRALRDEDAAAVVGHVERHRWPDPERQRVRNRHRYAAPAAPSPRTSKRSICLNVRKTASWTRSWVSASPRAQDGQAVAGPALEAGQIPRGELVDGVVVALPRAFEERQRRFRILPHGACILRRIVGRMAAVMPSLLTRVSV